MDDGIVENIHCGYTLELRIEINKLVKSRRRKLVPRDADVSQHLDVSCKGRSLRSKPQATPYDVIVWVRLSRLNVVIGTPLSLVHQSNCGKTRSECPDRGGVSVQCHHDNV